MGGFLELELDRRLQASAMLIKTQIEKDLTNLDDETNLALLQSSLLRVLRSNDLQGAYLIDEYLTVITDARNTWDFENRSYLQQDSLFIHSAFAGNTSVSPLYTIEGSHFKNVYTLVQDLQGQSAVLVLEANADFFDILTTFKKGLFIEISASIALLILVTFFLLWMVTLWLKTEERLYHTEHLAAMGQMAATVAHEIRNPLGIMKGTADILKERYSEKGENDELFDYIPYEIKRLDRLVNDFLYLSKEPKLELRTSDIYDTLKNAILAMEREIDTEKHTIQMKNTTKNLNVLHDPNAIHQVMLNLIHNSVQAMGDNSGIVAIEISLDKYNGKPAVKIRMTDTGPGFKGNPDTLFEPFYTTKTRGTGLGLAVCRRLIEQHRGQIEAVSNRDDGMTITILLPI